jgi:hypothetical protein
MRQVYLTLLALSLREVLRSDLLGRNGLAEPLSNLEYETLLMFCLKNPKVSERYHSPKVCKKTWLKELEQIDGLW